MLLFLICFAGLYYFLPRDLDLPTPETFIPGDLIHSIFRDHSGRRDTLYEYSKKDILSAKTDTSLTVTRDSAVKVPEDNLPVFVRESLSVKDSIASLQAEISPVPLQKFFDSLRYSRGQVRIMYYGDSQIEGDRLTSYLRSRLRKNHGGAGPGLFLPVMPVTYTRSVYIRASSNWERYNYLSFKNGVITHNQLGPFMAFCRYIPEKKISSTTVKAWIRIVPSKLADSSTSRYDFLRILYRNARSPVKIEVKAGDFPTVKDTLRTGMNLQEFICPLYNADNVLIDFSGMDSPDIYGISIESKTGVIVDNIPQRGSAGLEFTMIDKENLRDSYSHFSPDLIVLHYGLNIVRNVRANYSYYEKGLERQLSLLKDIIPGAEFLVIGLTDMAYADGDLIRSYPNIPDIIGAQKKASDESGAHFWDSYGSMGGDSSIIRWFGMNPPLAKPDYVHFTDQGADTLAEMMMSEVFSVDKQQLTDLSDVILPGDTIVNSGDFIPAVQQVITDKNSFFSTLASKVLSYDPEKPFIFTSPAFWIFFLFVLAGYSMLYKRLFVRNLYLFLISLFFYYKTGGLFLFLLILVTVIDFTCGLLIYNSRTRTLRRIFILISIVSNIGILAYFKYSGFFINTFNDIFNTRIAAAGYLEAFSNNLLGTHFDISKIILPVGISFFTFQSLSYTIDVYRKKLDPVRNIIDFGFYVSFFPQLVAGPIVRASEFIPQLYSRFQINQREFSHALFLISKGLIKKIIISDFIAVNFVDRVFDLPTSFSGLENLMAVYGYGLQIYCDFSGYTDIAIGLALILGFRLPLNFNSPYKASNVSEFWKRWHISLSRWLKDYLYIPLGGNRKGRFRTIVNLMITMLLGGLWHGADLRFVIWGGLHGIGLVFNKIWSYLFGTRSDKSRVRRALSVFMTFQFVSFCWIFFRAPDMHSIVLMMRQIFGSFLHFSNINIFAVFGSAFILMAAGYIIHFLPEKLKESYRGLFIRIPVPGQIVIIMVIAIFLYQMRATQIMPFIYFRF